jgi:hypothetical protein
MTTRILIGISTKNPGKELCDKLQETKSMRQTCIGRPIDMKRIAGTQLEALESFYNLVEDTRTSFSIKIANIWNMDEHGIAEGQP